MGFFNKRKRDILEKYEEHKALKQQKKRAYNKAYRKASITEAGKKAKLHAKHGGKLGYAMHKIQERNKTKKKDTDFLTGLSGDKKGGKKQNII